MCSSSGAALLPRGLPRGWRVCRRVDPRLPQELHGRVPRPRRAGPDRPASPAVTAVGRHRRAAAVGHTAAALFVRAAASGAAAARCLRRCWSPRSFRSSPQNFTDDIGNPTWKGGGRGDSPRHRRRSAPRGRRGQGRQILGDGPRQGRLVGRHRGAGQDRRHLHQRGLHPDQSTRRIRSIPAHGSPCERNGRPPRRRARDLPGRPARPQGVRGRAMLSAHEKMFAESGMDFVLGTARFVAPAPSRSGPGTAASDGSAAATS